MQINYVNKKPSPVLFSFFSFFSFFGLFVAVHKKDQSKYERSMPWGENVYLNATLENPNYANRKEEIDYENNWNLLILELILTWKNTNMQQNIYLSMNIDEYYIFNFKLNICCIFVFFGILQLLFGSKWQHYLQLYSTWNIVFQFRLFF